MTFYSTINLTLKKPSEIAADNTLICLTFIFQRKEDLMFHVNPLSSRGFTQNIVLFSLKNSEKILKTVVCCSHASWHLRVNHKTVLFFLEDGGGEGNGKSEFYKILECIISKYLYSYPCSV